ncbi:MAG: hypothetical protein EBZ77_06865 [Chitinophagia bacterium]|nr:hypothetical protein [Chitinophagia bacterium]
MSHLQQFLQRVRLTAAGEKPAIYSQTCLIDWAERVSQQDLAALCREIEALTEYGLLIPDTARIPAPKKKWFNLFN